MIFRFFIKIIEFVCLLNPAAIALKSYQKIPTRKFSCSSFEEILFSSRAVFSVLISLLFIKSIYMLYIIFYLQITSLAFILSFAFTIKNIFIGNIGRYLFLVMISYVEVGFSMAYIYWSYGEFSANLSRVDSIYYSFVTMTTLGYGDIYPVSDVTKILSIAHAFFGMLIFSVIIGLLASRIFTQIKIDKAQ